MGWAWATELARQGHTVTVLTRSANRQAIEPEAGKLPAQLRFLYYDLPAWAQTLRRLPEGRPAYYVLWQWFAARMIKRRFPRSAFDRVQHVTYVSARYPSFMGSLGIPFCFGPVSGGETVPPALRSGFSRAQRCRELLRDLSNRLVAIDQAVISEATLERGVAILSVRFEADIAAVTRNSEGQVVAGSLSDAVQTRDVWTFRRDTGSRDPNWVLVETDEEE